MAEPELDASVTTKNRVEKAREFYDFATLPPIDTIRRADRQSAWTQLWLIKQQAKYGWDRLGFDSREAARIKLNKPNWV
jgi:hypothetical protein